MSHANLRSHADTKTLVGVLRRRLRDIRATVGLARSGLQNIRPPSCAEVTDLQRVNRAALLDAADASSELQKRDRFTPSVRRAAKAAEAAQKNFDHLSLLLREACSRRAPAKGRRRRR